MRRFLAAVRRWLLLSNTPPAVSVYCECGPRDPYNPGQGAVVYRYSESVGDEEIQFEVFTCGLCGEPLPPEPLKKAMEDEDEMFRPVDHTHLRGPDRDQWGLEARRERGAL